MGCLATSGGSGWFVANRTYGWLGSGLGSDPTEFLIGTATYTMTDFSWGQVDVSFVLRERKEAGRYNTMYFRSDGYGEALPGWDPRIIVTRPVVIMSIPEPGSTGVLLMGGAGLLLRRRKTPYSGQ